MNDTCSDVTTKKQGGRDPRQEPAVDPGGESATNYRVDRVYTPGAARTPISQATSSLMTSQRARRVSTGPELGTDTELALRRQLSRLQRQLSDAQRELANKDDELAVEVEKRIDTSNAHAQLLEEHNLHKQQLDELLAYRARTTGVEQRLQEAVATADELAHVLELERGERSAAHSRAEELAVQLEDTRAKAGAEKMRLEEQRATETVQLEAQKRSAIESAETAMEGATSRLRDAHEAELTQLRAAHERSLATLRGELEPKALAARNLEEERVRLTSELEAARTESTRAAGERDETHKRELAQVVEMHAAEQTAHDQRHAAELARIAGERDTHAQAVEQATRTAELREQYWESTIATLREAQKKLQRDVAEAKERCAGLEADKASIEERLGISVAATAQLVEDKSTLQEQLDAATADAHRNALDRARFVAYLEEGMAMLGALPPSEPVATEPAATESAPASPQETATE